MKTSLTTTALVLAMGVCSAAIVGCGSSSANTDKMGAADHMGGDAMDDGKMGMDAMGDAKMGMEAMEGGKMAADAPMNDKMEPMKMDDKMDDGKK